MTCLKNSLKGTCLLFTSAALTCQLPALPVYQETPYAEGLGDDTDLSLDAVDLAATAAAGNSLTSPAIPVTGGWQNWTTLSAGSIDLPAGILTLRVTVNSPGGDVMNLNWMEFR